jgi:NitT/TauT family transport system ATP-binding protein
MIAVPGQGLALARDDQAAAARTRIAVQGLAKRFNASGHEFVAVDDVSFEVKQGEFVALLGPSGCGKSTILNMVAGLLPRSGGRILIDEDTVETGKANPRVGYVFQRDTLFPWRTVEQNIGYGLEIAGLPKTERAGRVASAVEKAGLAGFAQSFPRMLSGGMRQRVALAAALVGDPGFLVLDEPTVGLDPEQRMRFRELIAQAGEGRTVLLSTHQTEDVAMLCHRVLVMAGGRIRFDGTPAELTERAAGRVWSSAERDPGAKAGWRTGTGSFRNVGTPPAGATLVEPTLEDGYLLTLDDAGAEVAA